MRKVKARRGKQPAADAAASAAAAALSTPSAGNGVTVVSATPAAAVAAPVAGAGTNGVAAARQFPAGDPVFVLHRQSVARPTPAHFKRHLWARWCTRLTEEGACTFRGCTFVHSLTEFGEWAADSNAPAHTPLKWREQQCKLSFRAAVDAAEALETGAPLPNEVPGGGIEFNNATPMVVRRDWTQPKADSRWRMRVARRPPGLSDPRLAAVLCSSQHVQVDVVPRSADGARPTPLSAERVKRLAWDPLPVTGTLLLSARTSKRELRARLALVFVDGSKDKGPKDRSAVCTVWAEVQIRAIQPVCLFNEDADSTSLFHDGKRGLREMGVGKVVSDPWDDPVLDGAVPLAPYRMPSVRVMKRAASLHSNSGVRASEPGLFTPLNAGSYADRFHSLLCLNHASHLAALRAFATTTKLENAHPYQGMWSVNVQAGRSVEGESLYGVCVAVRPVAANGEPSATLLLGHVTDAHDTELKLEFAMAGQPLLRSGTEVCMWLYPPSLRYRLMHRAIEDARPLLPRLFGDSATPDAWRTTRSQDYLVSQGQQWRNVLETLDGDQRRVVESLLAQSAQAVPTVVMGPFGCGKSHAIIRAILAALFGRRGGPGAVLVATQTNSAADYLARAVVGFGPLVSDEAGSRVMRLYATTRSPGQVDADLLRSSNYSSARRAFVAPTYADVKDKLVIVTTCVMAGALRSAGFGPATVLDARGKRVAPTVPLPEGADDHFTDIIIDEAAQVWEPEALIPISLAGPRTKITLVGDPQQQQPSVHSWLARRCGLGRSVLERMYELPCYVDDKTTATRCRILLRNNYRCHKEIVQFAAEFYPYNIIPNCTLAAPMWPNTRERHALVFQPVVHDDPPELLNRGGSITEADATIQVAMELVRAGDVALEDILIIAPHFLQMQVIRSQAKRSRESRRLNVDSITNVQGREFSVLIISTLSKFARNLQTSRRRASSSAGGAGFGAGAGAGAGAGSSPGGEGEAEISRVTPTPTLLGNRRLFNTVVTRAKRLVVAVGNPADLQGDSDWARFLRLAYKAPAELRGVSPVARTPAASGNSSGGGGGGGGGGRSRRGQRGGSGNTARAPAPAAVDPPRVDSLPPRITAPVAAPAPAPAPVLPPPQPEASGPSSLGGTPLRKVARSPTAAPGSPAPVAPPSSAQRRVGAVGGTPLMSLSPHVGARAAATPPQPHTRVAPGPSSAPSPAATSAPPGLGGDDEAPAEPPVSQPIGHGRPWGAAPGGLPAARPQSQDALVDSLATAPLPPVSSGPEANAATAAAPRQMSHPARPEEDAGASAVGAAVAPPKAPPAAAAYGGAYAAGALPGVKPPFESLQIEDVFLFALRHDQDGAVRGLYTRKQVQAVLRELWQGVDHWQVCRVTPLRLVFSVFVPLRQCVFNGQFVVPMDVPIERALWPHAMPLW